MDKYLKQIEAAVRDIRLAQLDAQIDARDKHWYVIWKNVEDRNVADVNDITGLFYGTYKETDALIERLNKADPSVKGGLGRKRWGYWRSEPPIITIQNEEEFLEFT